MERHADIRSLLQSLFSPAEFYTFFQDLPRAPLGELLPHQHTTRLEFFSHAVDCLGRYGLLQEPFFTALVELRPLRRAHIVKVQALFCVVDTSTSESSPATVAPSNPFDPYAPFVGRQKPLRQLTQLLQRGASSLLIGGRRAGKTTLIEQLSADRLGRRLLLVDAASWTLESEASVLGALTEALGQPIRERRPAERLLQKMAPLAVVIDEADQILDKPWADPFLSWLRYLDDGLLKEDLAFLLVGGTGLARYRVQTDNGSPPLNTTRPVYLDALDHAARAALFDRFEQDRPALDRAAVSEEAGGHPWLLSRLLGQLWDHVPLDDALDCVDEIGQPHFLRWWQQLDDSDRSLLQKIDNGGIHAEQFRRRGPLRPLLPSLRVLESLCLIEETNGALSLGPALARSALRRLLKEHQS